MKVTLRAEYTEEVDGTDGHASISSNVTTIYDLLWLYQIFCSTVGFSYVKSTAVEDEDGKVIWSDF